MTSHLLHIIYAAFFAEVDADDSLDIFTASQSQSTATASASDGLISVSPTHAIDYFDLQIDYWPVNALSAKKDSPASKAIERRNTAFGLIPCV